MLQHVPDVMQCKFIVFFPTYVLYHRHSTAALHLLSEFCGWRGTWRSVYCPLAQQQGASLHLSDGGLHAAAQRQPGATGRMLPWRYRNIFGPLPCCCVFSLKGSIYDFGLQSKSQTLCIKLVFNTAFKNWHVGTVICVLFQCLMRRITLMKKITIAGQVTPRHLRLRSFPWQQWSTRWTCC